MKARELSQILQNELSQTVVGQPELARMLTLCLIAGGHVLLEGAPGLGKTLAARVMAKTADVPFKRVQFTPDLMPSDILGTNVWGGATGTFELTKGPIFTAFLLADEINRTPPKTQSALLEAMEEGRVTIDGQEYALPQPFMVFATQNPVEYEGTYPLPEAQLDRFMMKLTIGYPPRQEELRLLGNIQRGFNARSLDYIRPLVTAQDILSAREEARGVTVEDSLMGYLMDILEATRRDSGVLLGASPRAGIAMLSCAKVGALMDGRDFCVPEDFQSVAVPLLRHRLMLTPDAEIDGFTTDGVIDGILRRVAVPR